MMVTAPTPTAPKTPTPAQTVPPAPSSTPAPTGTPAPGGTPAPQTPDAAAKAEAINKVFQIPAAQALTQAGVQLKQVSELSIGGGTPDGAKSATSAVTLLTETSKLIQHADVKLVQQLQQAAADLHMKLMGSATDLAVLGGQLITADPKVAIKVGDVAKDRLASTMTTVNAALALLSAVPGAGSVPASAPNAPSPTPAPVPGSPTSTPKTPATKAESK